MKFWVSYHFCFTKQYKFSYCIYFSRQGHWSKTQTVTCMWGMSSHDIIFYYLWGRPHVEELAAGEYWICTFFGLLQEVKTNEHGDEYYEEQIMGQCIPKLLFYFFIFLVMMIWNFMYVSPLFFGLLVTQSISNYSLNDNVTFFMSKK